MPLSFCQNPKTTYQLSADSCPNYGCSRSTECACPSLKTLFFHPPLATANCRSVTTTQNRASNLAEITDTINAEKDIWDNAVGTVKTSKRQGSICSEKSEDPAANPKKIAKKDISPFQGAAKHCLKLSKEDLQQQRCIHLPGLFSVSVRAICQTGI